MATKPELPPEYQTQVLTDFERRNYGNATDLRPPRVTTNNSSDKPVAPPPVQQDTAQKK